MWAAPLVVASYHVPGMTFLARAYDVVSLAYRGVRANTCRTMSDISEVTRGRLRRLNLIMVFPSIAVGGVLLVALDTESWWDAAVLGLVV